MKQHLSSAIAFSETTHLQALAANNAVPLGVVDMSTNDYPSAKVRLTINLSTATVDGGTVDLYFLASLDNSNWTDGLNPATSASQSSEIVNAERIKEFRADVEMQTKTINWVCNDLQHIVGDLPPYWTLLIHNLSGSTFEGSGHTAEYMTMSYKGST
jgi:hypothetical protein